MAIACIITISPLYRLTGKTSVNLTERSFWACKRPLSARFRGPAVVTGWSCTKLASICLYLCQAKPLPELWQTGTWTFLTGIHSQGSWASQQQLEEETKTFAVCGPKKHQLSQMLVGHQNKRRWRQQRSAWLTEGSAQNARRFKEPRLSFRYGKQEKRRKGRSCWPSPLRSSYMDMAGQIFQLKKPQSFKRNFEEGHTMLKIPFITDSRPNINWRSVHLDFFFEPLGMNVNGWPMAQEPVWCCG